MPSLCLHRWVARLRGGLLALALIALGGGTAGAQTFSSQGPAPSNYPVTPVIDFNGNWAGAIQSILVNPSDANSMLISGVNGGIWRTLNGGTTWTPLTDRALSLSVDSLSYDPTDPTHQKIYAGVGITSNGLLSGQSNPPGAWRYAHRHTL